MLHDIPVFLLLLAVNNMPVLWGVQ